MAIQWCDGVDQYGEIEDHTFDGVWFESVTDNAPTTSLGGTIARNGAKSYRGDEQTKRFRRHLTTDVTTAGFGFGCYLDYLPEYNNANDLMGFFDDQGLPNLVLCIQSTGTIEAFRGYSRHGTSLGVTAAPAISPKGWAHVEVKFKVSAAATGTVEVRVNGVTVLDISGVPTQASYSEAGNAGTPNAIISQVHLCGRSFTYQTSTLNENTTYYDDMVLWDTTGSYNNDFIGDHFVRNLYPSANTVVAEWTDPSGGGYTSIDDVPADEDTSYLYAGTPGSPELVSEFEIDNLSSTSGSIAAVVANARSRKDNADDAELQLGVVSGSSVATGSVSTVQPVYYYNQSVFETDPSSGVPFTPTGVNNAKLQINRSK